MPCVYCFTVSSVSVLLFDSLCFVIECRKDYECFKDVDSVLVLDTEAKQGGELWNRGKSVADLSDDDFNQLVEDFDCEVKILRSMQTEYDMSGNWEVN